MTSSDFFFNALDESYKEICIQSKPLRLEDIKTIQTHPRDDVTAKKDMLKYATEQCSSERQHVAHFCEDFSDTKEDYKMMAMHYKSLCKVKIKIVVQIALIPFSQDKKIPG